MHTTNRDSTVMFSFASLNVSSELLFFFFQNLEPATSEVEFQLHSRTKIWYFCFGTKILLCIWIFSLPVPLPSSQQKSN